MPRIRLHKLAERTNHGVTVTLFGSDPVTPVSVRVRESNLFGCFTLDTDRESAYTDWQHPYLRAPEYVPLRSPMPMSAEGEAWEAAQEAAALAAAEDGEAAAA